MANRVTNQQLQEQVNQQQQQLQDLLALVNNMNQNMQQLLAAQGGQQVGPQPPQGQVADEPLAAELPAQNVLNAPVVAPVQPGVFTLEKFIKNGAKAFKGTTEPEKAEAWTLNILKTFRAMEVPENHWVRLASCMLEEEAAFWWEAALRTNFVGRQFETILWAEFMDVFNNTYYPEQVREQKAREFSNLKQDKEQTVREYEQKFIQLERFAPSLCTTEKARTNKFVWGLRFALKDRVASQRPQTLAESVAAACVAEEVLLEQYGPLNKKEKTKTENTSTSTPKQAQNSQNQAKSGDFKRKRNGNGSNNYESSNGNRKPKCFTCKRRHDGPCMKDSNKCYLCGEAGHMKRDCPKAKDQKSHVQANLNATTAGEAARNKLVQGMITISSIPALLLFDSGCTHSFMSFSLARKLGLKPRLLDFPLNVSTPNGNQTLVDK